MTNLTDALESSINKEGLDVVVEALQEVCYLKADLLRSRENKTSEWWERVAKALDHVLTANI